jgi:hypothetical protein
MVVLEGSEVIASGSNVKQLHGDVRAKGLSSPFPIFVTPVDGSALDSFEARSHE